MDDSSFTAFEPPEGLLQRILTRIRAEERLLRTARINLFLFGAMGLLSFTALIPAYQALKIDMAASGLPDLLSLAVSDPAIITLLWREFSLSLFEALPAASIAAVLMVIFVGMASFRVASKKFTAVTPQLL